MCERKEMYGFRKKSQAKPRKPLLFENGSFVILQISLKNFGWGISTHITGECRRMSLIIK